MSVCRQALSAWTRAAAVVSFVVLSPACSAFAEDSLFTEDFESYAADTNLRGQGGWDGMTNQDTASEMPIWQGYYLTSGKVLDTRAIAQADRIHQIGHALPAFDASVVTVFSAEAYALADSNNTGFGIGETPAPGPGITTAEGFMTDYRAYWAYSVDGWYLDLRGIAGDDPSNYLFTHAGTGVKVVLKIVVDGPGGVIYGVLDDGEQILTTASRAINPGQISAIDAVAIFSDRSLPDRNGIELDNILLTATAGTGAATCGDVNRSGELSASDALLVLKAAVGQPVALQCPPAAQPLKTGQTTCHNVDGSPLTCIDTEQDGEWQLGVARQFVDNGDGTIGDVATGLQWEKLSDDESIHDFQNTYTWDDAFGKVQALNEAGFAGHDDWRLPNVRELETLRDFNVAGPPVASIFREPCTAGGSVLEVSCYAASYYWSSTTWSGNLAVAWVVLFETGTTDASLKNTTRHVRAVRSTW